MHGMSFWTKPTKINKLSSETQVSSIENARKRLIVNEILRGRTMK